MVADVGDDVLRRPAEEAGEVRCDALGLAEAEAGVQGGLHRGLRPRLALPAEVGEVAKDAGGDVADAAARRLGEGGGDLHEVDRAGAGQVVGLAEMRGGVAEDGRRGVGEVAEVDEGDLAAAGGQVEPVVLPDVAQVGLLEVLGEEAGAEDDPVGRALPQPAFGGGVGSGSSGALSPSPVMLCTQALT